MIPPVVHTLPNGLRVILQKVSDAQSFTFVLSVRAGSVFETHKERGIAHFLEHMFFKGSRRYPNAHALTKALDDIGGPYNARTGVRFVDFYTKSSTEQMPLVFDLFSEIFLNPLFQEEEINLERGVIIEEKREDEEHPASVLQEQFWSMVYGDQPWGHPIIGLEENILSFQKEDFIKYREDLYTPDNCLLSIAGGFDEQEVLTLAQQYFGSMQGTCKRQLPPFLPETITNKHITLDLEAVQTHLLFAFPGIPLKKWEQTFAQDVVAHILWGMMSSRLLQNIREKMGVCYTIGAGTFDSYEYGGLDIGASVQKGRGDEVTQAIMHELARLREEITQEEFDRAVKRMRVSHNMSLESLQNRAFGNASQLFTWGMIRSPETYLQALNQVTLAEVQAYAQKYLVPENMFTGRV